MNREIKFKFWLTGINKMTYAHDLSSIVKVFPEITSDMIALQFAGVKDKNSVDIFEGDIVSIVDLSTRKEPLIAEVYFDLNVASFSGKCKEYPVDLFLHNPHNPDNWIPEIIPYLGVPRTIEVIGNIYENPELLNATA